MKIPIIIAFGVEFRNLKYRKELQAYLKKLTKSKSDTHFKYKKGDRDYDIQIVFTRDEFLKALDTPGAIVVYEGHARHGQGPAFDETGGAGDCPSTFFAPKNPWENHVRMGWDAVKLPVKGDILKHCVNPDEYAEKKVSKYSQPSVRYVYRKASTKTTKCSFKGYSKRKLIKCFPSLAKSKNKRGVASLLKRHFWYTKDIEKTKKKDPYTFVKVGAKDLKKSKLKCRLFFMDTCKAVPHYYCSLRHRKRETKSKCIFLLTRKLAYMGLSKAINNFIKLVLEEDVDPFKRSGRKRLITELNAVNAEIFKTHTNIKYASGIIGRYSGREKKKKCPSWN